MTTPAAGTPPASQTPPAAAGTPPATPPAAGTAGAASGGTPGTAAGTPAAAGGEQSILGGDGAAALAAAGADIKLELPTGVTMDTALLAEVRALAADGSLTPQQRAEKTLALGLKQLGAAQANFKAQQLAQAKSWGETLAKSPTFVDDRKDAAKVIAQFGDPSLVQWFNESGAGNHPALFTALAKAGRFIRERLSEDSSAVGGAGKRGAVGNPVLVSQEARRTKFYDGK